MKTLLNKNWKILQDVHDTIETIGVDVIEDNNQNAMNQISEWEPLSDLKQLQQILSKEPYFGRELRYFNDAPWWYKNTFTVSKKSKYVRVTFTNVDYYCKLYLNGEYLGFHEGYSDRFNFDISNKVKRDQINTLLVKVWSPFDEKVESNLFEQRTAMVMRNMVKGTYEHSDGLLQRDVNPVGIYGNVYIEEFTAPFFDQQNQYDYNVDIVAKTVTINVTPKIKYLSGEISYKIQCVDYQTNEVILSETFEGTDHSFTMENVQFWSCWDRGEAYLYVIKLDLYVNGQMTDIFEQRTGFRSIELARSADETSVILNGEKIFVRGSSYFPDQYVSAMNQNRYKRDLLQVKQAGFNLLRIHVHVEFPEFYDLCDEMGIILIQDSEYNWMHPFEGDFADRFIDVYTKNIEQMRYHPSIAIWVGMNEPGILEAIMSGAINPDNMSLDYSGEDPMKCLKMLGTNPGNCRAMSVHPGPKIFSALKKHIRNAAIIKGSFCYDDLDSGDSHNYVGSLFGENTHFLQMYGSKEKFNSEYGFDSLPCVDTIKKTPKMCNRLERALENIDENQEYQYKYIKYVTEHYRLQKYKPCSGYIQFLFCDTTPVSFYGIYDYYNMPKKGLNALLESNQPVAVMLKFGKYRVDGLYIVNDYDYPLGEVNVHYTIEADKKLLVYDKRIYVEADSMQLVEQFEFLAKNVKTLNIKIIVRNNKGSIITTNHYEDIFNQPPHAKGHPGRISNEIGSRLYTAE